MLTSSADECSYSYMSIRHRAGQFECVSECVSSACFARNHDRLPEAALICLPITSSLGACWPHGPWHAWCKIPNRCFIISGRQTIHVPGILSNHPIAKRSTSCSFDRVFRQALASREEECEFYVIVSVAFGKQSGVKGMGKMGHSPTSLPALGYHISIHPIIP